MIILQAYAALMTIVLPVAVSALLVSSRNNDKAAYLKN